MYLYHVLFSTINICGVDYPKKTGTLSSVRQVQLTEEILRGANVE
jgi:hypothetical protein